MEKHRCKLCSKTFSNGRALGGHMKSHLVAPRPTRKILGGSHHDSSPSSSSSSFSDPHVIKSMGYMLRENPRKSFRVADPVFSSANMDSGSSSLLLLHAQDDVEDTESEPGSPVRKRVRKSGAETRRQRSKKTKKKTTTRTGRNPNVSMTESPEPASSVCEASPEEDLAMCLIIMSRDARRRDMKLNEPVFEETEEGMKPEKRQSLELRSCLIDLNLPPPAEDGEACSIVSAA